MKKILKITAFVMLVTIAALVSCTKESTTGQDIMAPLKRSPDFLSGTEFIFSDLPWETGDIFGNKPTDDVYAATPARPDLFDDVNRRMKVSILPDNSSTWIDVPRAATPFPANNGYVYEVYRNIPVLYVFSLPVNPRLMGSNVSVRVVFP